MSQSFLIDGYNLLFTLGIAPDQVGPQELHKARERLLGSIAAAHHGRDTSVTVVFDARHTTRKNAAVQQIGGIDVLFAVKHDEADDLIEERIRGHSHPRQLVVVSDDRRLQQAARRRRCQVMTCAEYLDWGSKKVVLEQAAAPAEAEKQVNLTSDEVRHWLEEFRDLGKDAAFKELNPFDLADDE
jgi:predicted RNA-binding protein with PIN domain